MTKTTARRARTKSKEPASPRTKRKETHGNDGDALANGVHDVIPEPISGIRRHEKEHDHSTLESSANSSNDHQTATRLNFNNGIHSTMNSDGVASLPKLATRGTALSPRPENPQPRANTQTASPRSPVHTGEPPLLPLEIVFMVVQHLKSFIRLVGLFWYDESGSGPLNRFLMLDRPMLKFFPSLRVLLFTVFGFLTSAILLLLSGDEFLGGPALDASSFSAMGNSSNASSPNEPVYISFKDVGFFSLIVRASLCSVPLTILQVGCYVNSVGRVLEGITGDIRPGRVTSIMGASGSGKTTLALALLGRSHFACSNTTGTVSLNGVENSTLDMFLDRVGFVPQADVLYPELTVYETLDFSARWRLPRYFTDADREAVIDDALRTLNLNHRRDHRVGGGKGERGLSGGERRRVSIGVEMVAKPSVIVLDEPLSGLDGAAAYKLLQTLNTIAKTRNVSVVAVIHQPSERMVNLMDDIILLQRGRLVYHGTKDDVFGYLSSVLKAPTSSPHQQIETLLDIVSGYSFPSGSAGDTHSTTTASPRQEVRTLDRLPELFLASPYYTHRLKAIADRLKEYSRKNATVSSPSVEVGEEGDGGDERLAHIVAATSPTGPNRFAREVRDRIRRFSCETIQSQWLRSFCNVRQGLLQRVFPFLDLNAHSTSFPLRAKPGVFSQTLQWLTVKLKLEWRRNVFLENFIVVLLATVDAYVRSFNTSWSRKPITYFYISISLGMLGMMSAVIEDDILPVRRAVSSGMGVAGYLIAEIVHTFTKILVQSNIFSITFFAAGVVMAQARHGERRIFVCDPFSFKVYVQFYHLIFLNLLVARSLGQLITVLVDHNEKRSYVLCTGLLVSVHVFSLFTPTYVQLSNRGIVLLDRFDFTELFKFFGSFSYVRYFLEAMLLWDPDTGDKIGRSFMLKHHSYDEKNATACAITLMSFFLFVEVVRVVVFTFNNATDFNSLNDIPAFLIFLSKLIASHGTLLLCSIVLNEWPVLKKAWLMSINEAYEARARRGDVVDDEVEEMEESLWTPRGDDDDVVE